MGKLAMIIKTRTRPGKRTEVLDLYRQMLGPRALVNEAQEVVAWCADQHDPDVFYVFEVVRLEVAIIEGGPATERLDGPYVVPDAQGEPHTSVS